MEFLDERKASATIARLLSSATNAKLAVAFWGNGASELLGLNRSDLKVELLCNLESGACNPTEIRTLYGLLPPDCLKTDPRLHAKVYWTPEAAVIGSSNASINGLVVEGAPLAGWHEANLLVEERSVLTEIETSFDQLFKAGTSIEPQMIDEAERLWNARRRLTPAGAARQPDLIAAYRANPNHEAWRSVKMTFWSQPLSRGALEEIRTLAEIFGTDDIDGYEDWREELASGDQIIDFDLTEVEGATYWVALTDLPTSSKLTIVGHASSVFLLPFGAMSLTPRDTKKLRAAACEIVRKYGGEKNAVISIAAAAEILDSNSIPH